MSKQDTALQQFDGTFLHELMEVIVHQEIGKLMEYQKLIRNPTTRETWIQMAATEFGRLINRL